MDKKEYDKKYREAHKEEIKEYQKKYREAHKKENKEYQKKYREAHKKENKEYQKKYREANKEKLTEYNKEYGKTHKAEKKKSWHAWYEKNTQKHKDHNKQYAIDNQEKVKKAQTQYRLTKQGRANKLITGYKSSDKKHNRPGFNLTRDWVIEKIFNSSCIYCGETDWTKLGCDRIDNTKAHTQDNCVCACASCNTLRQKKDFKEFLLSQNPPSSSYTLS